MSALDLDPPQVPRCYVPSAPRVQALAWRLGWAEGWWRNPEGYAPPEAARVGPVLSRGLFVAPGARYPEVRAGLSGLCEGEAQVTGPHAGELELGTHLVLVEPHPSGQELRAVGVERPVQAYVASPPHEGLLLTGSDLRVDIHVGDEAWRLHLYYVYGQGQPSVRFQAAPSSYRYVSTTGVCVVARPDFRAAKAGNGADASNTWREDRVTWHADSFCPRH